VSLRDLGPYSDWVAAAEQHATLWPAAAPGEALRTRIREVLGFAETVAVRDVRTERTWTEDGVRGELLTWSVGYGPRTEAYRLRPADQTGPLPGVLALHDHGGFKYFGKEKIADGPEPSGAEIVAFRERSYGGRAFANALARRGYEVLVPDVFLWGSRKFPLGSGTEEIDAYNTAAREHEHLVSKYCTVLGTSLAGVVAYEDRAALAYLRQQTGRVACIGLSGGGCRAALLQATTPCSGLEGSVIVGMMSTYRELLDQHLVKHTWMFEPPGLARIADWPDLAASAAPTPLLVQYNRDDPLFSRDGMQQAHERIAMHYGSSGAYTGQFYDGPHKFDVPMQEAAFDWLGTLLGAQQ